MFKSHKITCFCLILLTLFAFTSQTHAQYVEVFVTSEVYTGNLGGLSGADTICNDLASDAGLSGNWTAWLSIQREAPDPNLDARDRIPDAEYRLVDGTVVAVSLSDLLSEDLQSPIILDETGNFKVDNVWTGTTFTGTASGTDCSGWTNGESSSPTCSDGDLDCGSLGDSEEFAVGLWTDFGLNQCGAPNPLYCFSELKETATQDTPDTYVYKLTQPVGTAGGLPDPDPFYIYPTEGTLVTRLVWEENKQLEAGPDPLGIIIHGSGTAIPYFGALLDAGLNPIPGTEFEGISGADAAQIDLADTTRFSGVLITLGNYEGTSAWMFTWTGTLTVVEGEAVGNQPPIANAGDDVSGTEDVRTQLFGGRSSDPDGSTLTYFWQFGDDTTGTAENPGHTYAEPNTYNVTLTVTDDQGAVDSDTTIVTIAKTNVPPTAWAGGEIDGRNRSYTGTVGVPLQFDGSLSSDDSGITSYRWDWGENPGDPNGEGVTPQHTYELAQTYGVELTVWDAQGESDADVVYVEIAEGNRAPVADAGPPVVGTSGVAVQFNGSASSDPDGAGLQYDWVWDDGTQDPDAGPSPQHTYSASGDYTVILTVTDADGISASDDTAATIDPPSIAPQADAGGAYTGTAGVAVAFDGMGSSDPDGSIAQYDWVFGDGTPVAADAGPTPSHTYAVSGPYSVSLTVTDNDGLTNSDTTQASIGNASNLSPTADPGGAYNGVAGVAVAFDGSGSSDPEGGSLRYDWNFGDTTITNDAGPTPSHTYATADSYVVTLTVTDDDGATDSQTTGASMAAANQRPVADANGPYTGAVNAAVAFDGTGSDDPDGSVVRYDWVFGDNTIANDAGPTPSHTYTDADIYTVTLTVTDDDGDTSAEAFSTVAIGSSNVPPVADAGGPYVSKVPVPVIFDVRVFNDPFGSITRYNWDFGDGTPVAIDAGPTPSHAYAAIGAYDVVLTVTDNQGAFARAATQSIIGDGINLPPTANPGELYTGEAGVALTFNGGASIDSDGTIVQYDWFFGDGGTGTSANPTHTYTEAGIYTVTLTVADDGGKTDTQKTIAVIGIGNQPPTAEAGGPYAGIINQGIQFYGSDSSDPDGTIAKTVWDFGDGVGTSLLLNPTYTYTTSGPFPVTLTVTDDDGATNTATTLVIVGATQIHPTAEADGPYFGEVGAPVTFDGTGSDDPDGSVTDYDWHFGDGNTGTGPTPDHTYGEGSRYHVTLQVTDDDDLPDADGTTVRIGQFSQPPTAAAGGPYNGRVSAPVTFDGTGSDDPDGDIVRYDWDFDDGTTVNDAGPTPDHAYAEGGRYRVALTVTDDSGETDWEFTVATIGIGNLPPEANAGDSVNGKVRRDITFDGTGSSDRDGNVVSYAWEFGDGNTDTGPNPTHSYADAGKYRVTMTVTDNDGATSSDITLADVESKSGGGGDNGLCFINTLMGQ